MAVLLRWLWRLALLVPLAGLLVFGGLLAGLAGFISLYEPPPRPEAPATIVVLSSGQHPDGRMGRFSEQRVAAALRLYRPGDVLVMTGNVGGPPERALARVMARPAQAAGYPVIIEDQARNTYENAQFSAEILAAEPDRPVLLVTNRFHLPRSWLYLWNAGADEVTPIPADSAAHHWRVWGLGRLPQEALALAQALLRVTFDGARPKLHPAGEPG